MSTVVTVVEVDVPVCSLTYGTSPCTAAIPTTGTRKCFNGLATCQDRDNYDADVLTLRFFRPSGEPEIFDGLAVLRGVSVTPQQLDPANNIGQRESVRVTLADFQHSDAGIDKYLADRGYDAYARGTFWGRFRARFPTLRGAELRVLRGVSGQPLSTFQTWHYVIDSTAGPAGGAYTIVAKDALKLSSGDRAQAPRPSLGRLASAISSGDGSLTLEPAGIGDLDYPASGKVAIGGNEIATFTRSADVLTLTDRGQANTEDADHDEGERVQLVLEYSAQRPDEIIADLFLSYTEIDPDWIDLAAWQAEIEAFTPRLYSALIAEPTDVDKLVNELVGQIGLVLWMDTEAQMLQLKGLRMVSADAAVIDADRFLADTFGSVEQLGKRVSQAWCYYGLRNPLEDIDDPKNYACIAVGVDETGADEEYGGEAIRTTFSRWISAFNRQAAERLNQVLLSRFRDPPRRISLDLYATDTPPKLGAGAYVEHFELQDDIGDEVTVPVQVISSEAVEDRFRLKLEEQAPVSVDEVTDDKIVYIDADGYNLNLRDIYDSLFSEPTAYDTVKFIVGASVKIGTRKGGNEWAVSSGDWPAYIVPELLIYGRIMGRGGNGGNVTKNGKDGEHALLVTVPIEVDNRGTIGGGGGGGGGGAEFPSGGGAGGGGGQGFEPSIGGAPSEGGDYEGGPGTPDEPGAAGRTSTWFASGAGGALGEDGEDSSYGGNGGGAGTAVHGDDLITWTNEGTILGDRLDSTDPLP